MSYFQDNRALFVGWIDSFACPACLGNATLSSREDVVVGRVNHPKRVHEPCGICKGRGTLADFSAVAEAIAATMP